MHCIIQSQEYHASFTIMQIIQRVQLDILKYILQRTLTDCEFNLILENWVGEKMFPCNSHCSNVRSSESHLEQPDDIMDAASFLRPE